MKAIVLAGLAFLVFIILLAAAYTRDAADADDDATDAGLMTYD